MRKSLLMAGLLALHTTASHGAVLSYAGFQHDTTTNVVTGNGLEWLRWDVTRDMSINQALLVHGADRWQLATGSQMVDLFNAFHFGHSFTVSENTDQVAHTGSNLTEGVEADRMFVQMFGDNYLASGEVCCDPANPHEMTGAAFGEDADGDGFYNVAIVYDDYEDLSTPGIQDGAAWLLGDDPSRLMTANFNERLTGIALVRAVEVNPVPVPAAAWLFGSALLGLAGRLRSARS